MGPIDGLRVSPHVHTRKSELQRFVQALQRGLHGIGRGRFLAAEVSRHDLL